LTGGVEAEETRHVSDTEETTNGQALIPVPKDADSPLQLLQAFDTFASKRLKVLADEIDERTETSIAIFGMVVIAAGFVVQLDFDGYQLVDLAASEFITVMIVGLLIVASGAARRAFQLRGIAQVEAKKIEEGARLAGATRGVGADPAADRS
jgi:hypothetical protein